MPIGIYKRNQSGWKHTEETKIKFRNRKGKKNSFYGKKHTEKSKEKMRKWHIGKKPSLETRIKRSKSEKGENHYNWKGGITPKKKIIRESLEYRLWRKAIFERDNFTCQKYGIKGGKLVAHHINNFAEKEELKFAIDNGITLSEKAHKEFHKRFGYKNNTKEQLEEFLAK